MISTHSHSGFTVLVSQNADGPNSSPLKSAGSPLGMSRWSQNATPRVAICLDETAQKKHMGWFDVLPMMIFSRLNICMVI